MAEGLLSPFHIRNLRLSSPSADTQNSLVQVTAPDYDNTISSNPEASLKYRDEDGDQITVGLGIYIIELQQI